MATVNELEMLAGKALLENTFLKWVLSDPKGAAASIGIKLDDAQAKAIQQIDPAALQKVADEAQQVINPPRLAWGG